MVTHLEFVPALVDPVTFESLIQLIQDDRPPGWSDPLDVVPDVDQPVGL